MTYLNKPLEQVSSIKFEDFELFEGKAIRGHHDGVDFFADYWATLAGLGEGRPIHGDIKPQAIRTYLPHVVLMDIEGISPLSLRVRLIGTHVTRFYGEMTGKLITELPNDNAVRRITTASDLVRKRAVPLLTITPGFGETQKHLVAYSAYAPIYAPSAECATDDDKPVIDRIMVANFVELISDMPLAERRHLPISI